MDRTDAPAPAPEAFPRVGVVIPCFNHGAFLEDAVRSALRQEHADVRVMIVNDGSNDATTPGACDACGRIDTERLGVVHQANAGLPAARNVGVRAFRERWTGWTPEFLVFLDADDWIEPWFVRTLHGAMLAAGDERVSHAYCQERLTGHATGVWRVPEWDSQLLLVTNLHPVTALVRRACFEAVGGFDESMNRGYEDWDFWLRLAGKGHRGVRVREPLFNWRRHSDQTMVMDAVKRHDELFAMLMQRHAGQYNTSAPEVIRRSNLLLRSADANWLDESGEAIVVRDMRAWVKDLVRERDQARAEAGLAARERTEAREALRNTQEQLSALRTGYERKPAVRVARAVYKVVDALPKPIGAPVRLLSRLLRGA